jgi:hypothetical protein
MRDGVRRLVERGEYRVDAGAVATAMLTRALALRTARTADPGQPGAARGASPPPRSPMLVAGEEIEVRRLGPVEGKPFPLENTA